MRIEDKVKEIALSMGFDFIIGDIYVINEWLKSVEQLPCLLYVLPTNGTIEITPMGFYKENINALLMFVDEDKIDPDGEETSAVIKSMRSSLSDFIKRANESGFFEPISSCNINDVLKDFNVNVSGVSADINFKEAVGSCQI